MKNPFRFRPWDVPSTQEAPSEWADNWASNFMAWFSLTFLDPWCSTSEHWTSRVIDFFWTDCPCCLFWRGVSLGILGLAILQLLIYLALKAF